MIELLQIGRVMVTYNSLRLATFLQNCEKLTLSAVPNILIQR